MSLSCSYITDFKMFVFCDHNCIFIVLVNAHLHILAFNLQEMFFEMVKSLFAMSHNTYDSNASFADIGANLFMQWNLLAVFLLFRQSFFYECMQVGMKTFTSFSTFVGVSCPNLPCSRSNSYTTLIRNIPNLMEFQQLSKNCV